jgi:hypothetical protein
VRFVSSLRNHHSQITKKLSVAIAMLAWQVAARDRLRRWRSFHGFPTSPGFRARHRLSRHRSMVAWPDEIVCSRDE